MLNLTEIADHLDMSDRNARDVLKRMAVVHGHQSPDWWKRSSLGEIRCWYIRDLREKAAGRGGADQEALTKAKTRQAEIDADNKELQFHKEVGNLVPVEMIEPLLSGWVVTARSEFSNAIARVVAGVESKHGITVDPVLIDENTTTAIEAVAAYPRFAMAGESEGIGEMGAAA